MRCHRAFWVYASDNGESISKKAATFARQQAAQEQPGANKTAENWLRSRAGRSLKYAWLNEPPTTRQKYYSENPDDGFPLEDSPTGFRDGRADRSRYPRMICADVERPQVLQNSSGHTCRSTSSEASRSDAELLQAAIDAETTALAFATKQKDIRQVISRSAALVECLGGQIAVMVPAQVRASALSVIAEAVMHVKGAVTQMVMYSDNEANDALLQMQTCVISANSSLEKYHQSAMTATVSDASVALETPPRALSPDEVAPVHRRKRLRTPPVTPQSSSPSLGEVARDVSADVSAAALGGDKSSGDNDYGNESGSNEDLNVSEAIAVERNSGAEFLSCGDMESDESSSSDISVFEDANVGKADTIVSHRFFRKRFPKNDAILVWTDLEDSENSRTVHVFPSDLNSVEADSSLTQTALNFFIICDVPRVIGVVCPCGSGLYVLMEKARRTHKAVTQQRLFDDLVALFNWSYQYLLLPVSGRNHWSFLIIENFMHAGPTNVYHVNSMRKAHSSAYAFDVLNLFLAKVHRAKSDTATTFEWSTYVQATKPQQSNSADCGLYVLHYMNTISTLIVAEKPSSIEDLIAGWTTGRFNATKVSVYRTQLYRALMPK
ncbi:Ulp1 protease family C-terminal catalytic domain-containing protein [Phytophthora infestans]|uniref:Ulp1 protease family C-terminal catalytic domain-containing protein n=1 Tax=Phytophthora infestans TaxID=4787 RepID=A0A8S9V3U4_PHYIN|nr:Ulp1 protease family C-terminal catalytic domain-containing protein [Phytophthora infestans]